MTQRFAVLPMIARLLIPAPFSCSAVGVGRLTFQLLLMELVGVFDFDTVQSHRAAVLTDALAWAAIFILGAMFEQFLLPE